MLCRARRYLVVCGDGERSESRLRFAVCCVGAVVAIAVTRLLGGCGSLFLFAGSV